MTHKKPSEIFRDFRVPMPTPAPRIMPERQFFGQAMSWSIMGTTIAYVGPERRLAPGERYLGYFVVPTFQRALVWIEAQKVRLIESLYMGLPIGSLVYNMTRQPGPCDGWLLDGQQRMSAIVDWVEGRLVVYGWRYPQLPNVERRHFQRLTVGVIETQIEDEAACRDIYERLLYGGTTP